MVDIVFPFRKMSTKPDQAHPALVRSTLTQTPSWVVGSRGPKLTCSTWIPLKPLRTSQPTIRLVHHTLTYRAIEILADGFVNLEPEYGTAAITVDLPESVVLPYEWITETRSHRRFQVPAEIINARRDWGRGPKRD